MMRVSTEPLVLATYRSHQKMARLVCTGVRVGRGGMRLGLYHIPRINRAFGAIRGTGTLPFVAKYFFRWDRSAKLGLGPKDS